VHIFCSLGFFATRHEDESCDQCIETSVSATPCTSPQASYKVAVSTAHAVVSAIYHVGKHTCLCKLLGLCAHQKDLEGVLRPRVGWRESIDLEDDQLFENKLLYQVKAGRACPLRLQLVAADCLAAQRPKQQHLAGGSNSLLAAIVATLLYKHCIQLGKRLARVSRHCSWTCTLSLCRCHVAHSWCVTSCA